MNYYPFGIAYGEDMATIDQPFKCNGKELDHILHLTDLHMMQKIKELQIVLKNKQKKIVNLKKNSMEDFNEDLKEAIVSNDLSFLEKNRYRYDINLRFPDEDNDTLLFYAISDPDSSTYLFFLNNGADITLVNDEGEGIVHSVVFSGLSERLTELVERGLLNPDLLNAQSKNGTTPLMLSVCLEKDKMFNSLIELGADINLADMEGIAPIHPACSIGNYNMVKTLVEKGADFSTKTMKGNYPLALAINEDHHEIVKYLYSKIYR